MVASDRYEQMQRVFTAVCDLDPATRERALDQECAGDVDLRRGVAALLSRDADPDSFLERPALGSDFCLQGGVAAAAGEPVLEDGEQLGPFKILRELGGGGQGIVYLAADERTGRRVALKALSTRLGAGRRTLERFRREAQAASRIDDPGVCGVHEIGEARGVSYFAMRYVEGHTLAARLRATAGEGRTVDILQVVGLIEQAARSVHVAHEAGVIHRDIKPGNIMVTPAGDPVVLDFGVARDERSTAELTMTGDVLGTPAYMAPEQIEGLASQSSARTDVYALGATLYEALTRHPPFEQPTRESLYRAVLALPVRDPRDLNPDIPRALAVVLQIALAKSPDQRYQTALEFAEDLRRMRERRPIRARPPGPVSRAVCWIRRNRALAAVIACIFITLTLGLAAAWLLLAQTKASLTVTRLIVEAQSLETVLQAHGRSRWPALPEGIPEMDRWLDRATDLRAALQAEQAAMGDAVGPHAVMQDELSMLRAGVPKLDAAIAEVIRRRDDALRITERTVVEPAAAAAWRDALDAIADATRFPQYGGLRLTPQVGLVPIGPDPASGLYEFAHTQTGDVPVRDPDTGRLLLTERTGVILVLVPGGTFRMGAERPSAERPIGSPNVDPQSDLFDELPVHDVTVAPFFIGKYEMTQGQWLHATGRNPSRHRPGSSARWPSTLLHPVETVTWEQCDRVLARLGLVLPTEAQWEYAARAGTTTVWWTGDEPESLQGAANVADRAALRAGAEWETIVGFLDDGYVHTAPVGSFRANPFGLHDVCGNVYEYPRDPYGPYGYPERAGDGLRQIEETGERISRGGGCYEGPAQARSASRYGMADPTNWTYTTGLRAARAIRGAMGSEHR